MSPFVVNSSGKNKCFPGLYLLLQNFKILFFFFFQLRLLAQCVKTTLAEFHASFQICNFPCISQALFLAENICAENRLSARDHKEVLTRF